MISLTVENNEVTAAAEVKATERRAFAALAPTPIASLQGVVTPAKRTKVAIIGMSPHWAKAPWDDPSFEIWAMNESEVMPLPRWDRWFEIHDLRHTEARAKGHIEWLTKQEPGKPIYLRPQDVAAYPQIRAGVPYPLKEIIAKYPRLPGVDPMPYATNTVFWQMALAMEEGFEEIWISGIDMAADCIHPDSKVLTAELRWVRAGELEVGQKLLAFDELPGTQSNTDCPYRQWRVSEVESVQRIMRPSYRINLADGTSIVASAGHQWLTEAEHTHRWKRTDELVTSMHRKGRPSNIVRLTDVWQEDKTWEGGYLSAAFDGEGHLCQNGRKHNNGVALVVGFSQKDNPMLRRVLELLENRFKLHMAKLGEDETHKCGIGGGRAQILRFLGEIRPTRLLEKFDPSNLGTLHRESVVAVESAEFIGEQEVIGLRTSTKTLIVEGLASHNSEYNNQRPSVEFMIGYARGKGIKVGFPVESDLLLHNILYGFEDDIGVGMVAKMNGRESEYIARANETERQLQQNDAEWRARKDQLAMQRARYEGAVEASRYFKRFFNSSDYMTMRQLQAENLPK